MKVQSTESSWVLHQVLMTASLAPPPGLPWYHTELSSRLSSFSSVALGKHAINQTGREEKCLVTPEGGCALWGWKDTHQLSLCKRGTPGSSTPIQDPLPEPASPLLGIYLIEQVLVVGGNADQGGNSYKIVGRSIINCVPYKSVCVCVCVNK